MGYTGTMRADCLSFLTDYGLADGFVAACHGVLLRHAPGVPVVDVTHLIPPGDVRRAAAVLAQTLPHLPAGVHLAVVDPGVGTERRALVLATPRGVLVGPDNGVLSWAAAALGGTRAAYALRPVPGMSATFHGRDLFAPAAGDLARGRDVAELADPVPPSSVVTLPAPVHRAVPGGLDAEVVTVDRFGNVQLAAGPAHLPERLLVAGTPVRHGETFGSVAPGEPVLYLDSAGLLALAVRDGNAADRFGLRPGDLVPIRFPW
jgi:hypothetical protein